MRILKFAPKLKQIILSPNTKQFVSGARRAGKSTALLYKVVKICMTEPKSKFLVGRYFHADLVGDTYEILFNEIDGLLNNKLGRRDKQTKTFYFRNGSIIHFRHLDTAAGLKGMTLTGYYIEQAEQIKETVWADISACLSGWGNPDEPTSNFNKYIEENKNNPDVAPYPSTYELLGCNPDALSFLKKKFVKRRPLDDTGLPTSGMDNEGWEHWYLTMFDNELNLGSAYIENQIKQNNDLWVKRNVYSSWDTFSGLIYEEFNEGHIKDHKNIGTLEAQYGKCKLISVLDPGLSHHFGVLFCLVTPSDRIMVIDELYEQGKTAQEMADLIKEKFITFGRRTDLNIMDFAANKKDGTSGKSYQDIFLENGITTVNAKKNVIEGINEVKNKFKNNSILISRKCKNLMEELQMYVWDEKQIDTPKKINDHLVDCLRYGVMHCVKVKEEKKEPEPIKGEDLQKAFNKSLVAKLNKPSSTNPIWDLYKEEN